MDVNSASLCIMSFQQYIVENFANFIYIFFSPYSSICYSIDYLFK